MRKSMDDLLASRVGVHVVLSGYEQRQERYRESNANKKAMDLSRRQARKNKRAQAY